MATNDDLVNFMYDKTDGRCFYCGKRLSFQNYGKVGEKGAWEIDHFIPFSRGGADQLHNLVPACVSCNTEKSKEMPWDFDPERFEVGERDPDQYL